MEPFDLGLVGIFARLFDSRCGINIRRHINVVRTSSQAGLEYGVVSITHAGITSHRDRMFLHQGRESVHIHGIRLHHNKATLRRMRGKLVGKNRIQIR